MGNLGMGELVVILLMLVLIFGARRLPQIGEGFGKAIRSFKRGLSGDEDANDAPSSQVKQIGSQNPESVNKVEVIDRSKQS